jgi:hypothetical protein
VKAARILSPITGQFRRRRLIGALRTLLVSSGVRVLLGPSAQGIRRERAEPSSGALVVALHAQRQGSLQIGWQQVGGAEAAWLQIGWQ